MLFRSEGVATNLPFHAAVLEHPEFERGGVDTGFVARALRGNAVPEA